MSSLQERLDEFKKSFESGAPPYNAPPEAIQSEARALGAQIIVITPELERYTRALHKKLNLSFDRLTDLHLNIAEQFGLVFTLPDYWHELYQSFGTALDRFHDEPQFRLPVPARCLIDRAGMIRAADVNLHPPSGAFPHSDAIAAAH